MHSLPHALLLGAQLWLGEASTNGCWAEGAEAQLPRNLEVGCLLGRTSGTLLPPPPMEATGCWKSRGLQLGTLR